MHPLQLLDHAGRLLSGRPDEADMRRSISAAYYAIFNLLTSEAATRIAGTGNPGLHATIRRSIEHRGIARICEGLLAQGRARPKYLAEIMPGAVPPSLLNVAQAFVELQIARLDADYRLEVAPLIQEARASLSMARTAFAAWTRVHADPATHAVLVAIAFSDRLTRRG